MMNEHRQPIGSCYEHVVHWVFRFGDIDYGEPFPTGGKIAHGYPTLTVEPFCKYGHAWVEFELDGFALVADPTREPIAWVPKAIYYGAGNIDPDEVTLYTKDEAREAMLGADVYGPWEEPPADAAFSNDEEEDDE